MTTTPKDLESIRVRQLARLEKMSGDPPLPLSRMDAIYLYQDCAALLSILEPAHTKATVVGREELNPSAVNSLRPGHQEQLDQDGIMIGVSRDALEHVLAWIDGQSGEAAVAENSALDEALEPFVSLHGINEQFTPKDDEPLRDYMPGVWPTWGDLKKLVALKKPQAKA